jgi:hypothetical protein
VFLQLCHGLVIFTVKGLCDNIDIRSCFRLHCIISYCYLFEQKYVMILIVLLCITDLIFISHFVSLFSGSVFCFVSTTLDFLVILVGQFLVNLNNITFCTEKLHSKCVLKEVS